MQRIKPHHCYDPLQAFGGSSRCIIILLCSSLLLLLCLFLLVLKAPLLLYLQSWVIVQGRVLKDCQGLLAPQVNPKWFTRPNRSTNCLPVSAQSSYLGFMYSVITLSGTSLSCPVARSSRMGTDLVSGMDRTCFLKKSAAFYICPDAEAMGSSISLDPMLGWRPKDSWKKLCSWPSKFGSNAMVMEEILAPM